MTDTKTATCGGCAAPIRWAVTRRGKRMPLDAQPNPAGNVVLEDTLEGTVAVVLGNQSEDPRERWMPHWATCPKAARFRGGR